MFHMRINTMKPVITGTKIVCSVCVRISGRSSIIHFIALHSHYSFSCYVLILLNKLDNIDIVGFVGIITVLVKKALIMNWKHV